MSKAKNISKKSSKYNLKKYDIASILPWSLMSAGVVGLLASFLLAVETINYIRDPKAPLSCSINPIVNCSSVIDTPQGEVLGFMNPLIGVVGFSMLIMFGLALLYKAKFSELIWSGAQAGALLGVVFVHWLIYSSVYVLGSLCPYCMTVWVVTIWIGLHITTYNLKSGLFGNGPTVKKINKFLEQNHLLVLPIWYALIIALIINHFSLSALLS